MISTNNTKEWQQSAIAKSLIALNLKSLEEEEIAEWYFGNLPLTARRNDGRIRDGYLRTYRDPLKGGWGIEGYDPTDFSSEPELRTFKPDLPRTAKDGKVIKYDFPKNSQHFPLLPRVSYEVASNIFRSSGLDFLQLTEEYAPLDLEQDIAEHSECVWFWQAVIDNPVVAVSVTEGGKKALSLLSQGRCAIAVSSITTWRKERGSKEVHPWLKLFAARRKFFLTFDQDVKSKTVRAVNKQSYELGNALLSAGAYRVRRISWDGSAKGIDDFIANLKSKYGDRFAAAVLRRAFVNSRDFRSFSRSNTLPGRVVKINSQFLSDDPLKKAGNFKILVVKSAKCTGKTRLLSQLVEEDRRSGIPTINVSHLERLARELGSRLGLPYRTEEAATSRRKTEGYSLCVDSLSPHNKVPFYPQQWLEAGVTLDEFTQVLGHLTFGTTEVGKHRKLTAETLGQKLADCWEQDRPIRLLDADADSESVEFVYDLIRTYSEVHVTNEELEAQTLTLVNEFEPSKGELHFYHEPSPKQIKADLIAKMRGDRNLLILTSSQQVSSPDGSINLEELAKKHYLPREILRIDSATVGDPFHPAFNITGKKIASLIENTDIKLVIASPAICTGISIDDLNCFFHAVFSFQAGNLPLNSIRQQLVRLRDFDVPRFLWCPKVGLSFVGSKSSNPAELLSDQKGESKLSLSSLGVKEAENLINSSICSTTKYWSKVGAKLNWQSYHYRELLLLDLESEGWNITHHYPEDDPNPDIEAVWEERKAIKQDSLRREDLAIAQAEEISHSKAQELKQRKNLTSNEQNSITKYSISQKYGVEVSPELLAAHRKNFYSSLKLQFWLFHGREYLESSDRQSLIQQQESNGGKVFLPDLNRKLFVTKVKLLELLNLERFLQPGTEWHNKNEDAIALHDFVKRDLIRFNQVLGCGIAIGDSPIVVLQKILKRIGQRLPYLRNERDGKKRLRVYGFATSNFDKKTEKEIIQSWLVNASQTFLLSVSA